MQTSVVLADTSITPDFIDGAPQGMDYYGNRTSKNFYIVDETSLYISSTAWSLRYAYDLGTDLSDVTYQAGNKNAYVLTYSGKMMEFNTDQGKVLRTLSIPFTNASFEAITKVGSSFFVATTDKILELTLSKNTLKIKNTWNVSGVDFSGMEYNATDDTLYLSDGSGNWMYFITLTDLRTNASGSTLDEYDFDVFFTPLTDVTGLCLNGSYLVFSSSAGEIISSLKSDLLSDARQTELSHLMDPPPTESYPPVPIGFWGLNGYITSTGLTDVQQRFGSTIFQVASSAPNYTVNTLLPLVKAAGMKVTLRMTGGISDLATNGNFDITKFKSQLDVWKNSGVQSYIDDGTLAGIMLLDDIFTLSGTPPTAAELDEMARYSEEILPGLMTFVRNKASTMPVPSGGRYLYLDACVNQYTNYPGYSDGAIADYVAQQKAAAASLGLGIINGLNIADGGDGSSGQLGASPPGSSGKSKYAMSPSEILTYGAALLDRTAFPDLKMFLMWEYDGEQVWVDGSIGSDYFDQPEMQEALHQLSVIATQP